MMAPKGLLGSRLPKEQQDAVAESLRAGATLAKAARANGVTRDQARTVARWHGIDYDKAPRPLLLSTAALTIIEELLSKELARSVKQEEVDRLQPLVDEVRGVLSTKVRS